MKLTTRFFTRGLSCLFICFISATTIHGQNNNFLHKKDSLLKVIASTQGEERLKTYKELAFLQFPDEEVDLMLQYANDFLREARKQQNKEYETIACEVELSFLWNSLRDEEYKRKANEYMPIFKKNGFPKRYYDAYESLLIILSTNSNLEQTIEGIKQMYAEAKQENYLYGITRATLLMAHMYIGEERNKDAEKYYKETIKNALELIKEEPDQSANYHLASAGYNGLANSLIDQKKLNELLALMPVWKKHLIASEKIFGHSDPCLIYYYNFCALAEIAKEKYDEAELYCDSIELKNITPLGLRTVWNIKSKICEKRKDYDSAIDWIDKHVDQSANIGELNEVAHLLKEKVRILSKMGRMEETYLVFDRAFQMSDSLRLLKNNAQLDEIRTQYEVDKHIAREEYLHNYLLFAIGSCILLVILLGVWIHYSRKITKKNRTLAQEIKELTTLQEEQINEMINKTSFAPEPEKSEPVDNDLCIESRIDKLCAAIRDLLLIDKIYRNPALTQELVIEILGTNKGVFPEAFKYCFKMPFKDYINFLRLKDAIQLLEQSDLSIEEISDIAGFGTARTFRNQFNAKYNMTPKDYRNSIQKGDISTGEN
ncbi:MAG: AraC family transcriptional regulator [Dysgonamonadaceae bacterium]|jgi:AraC-like DNA-binding protein|nr:AraC family transcriptional regulator [Dysgonamonadaceae bacterium]